MPLLRINLPAPVNPPLPALEISVTLDGTPYTLALQWNARQASWFLRVLDEPGQTVLMGDTRLSADWPAYRSRPRSQRHPPGLLMVYDTTGKGEDPQLATLGARHLLYYLSVAELPEGF